MPATSVFTLVDFFVVLGVIVAAIGVFLTYRSDKAKLIKEIEKDKTALAVRLALYDQSVEEMNKSLDNAHASIRTLDDKSNKTDLTVEKIDTTLKSLNDTLADIKNYIQLTVRIEERLNNHIENERGQ